MTLQLIGQLLEVKPTEYENKNTHKVTYGTQLTILFDGIDEEGYRNVSAETVQVDEDYRDILRDKIGTYIALSYSVTQTKNGTLVYPDRSMPVLELKGNPLDYSKFKKEKK